MMLTLLGANQERNYPVTKYSDYGKVSARSYIVAVCEVSDQSIIITVGSVINTLLLRKFIGQWTESSLGLSCSPKRF